MPQRHIYRDLLFLPGLAALGLLVVLVGMSVSDALRERQLEDTGRVVAENWLKNLDLDPALLSKSFEERRLALPSQVIFEQVGRHGQIFRLDFYDRDHQLFFSSGHGAWAAPPLEDSDLAAAGDGPASSTLHTVSTPGAERTYAAVTVPYDFAGKTLGFLRFFVDQTQAAAALTKSFGIIAAATAGLLLLSIGACAVVIGLKIRQHWRAQEHIFYLSCHDELTGLPNRLSFAERLDEALEACQSRNEHLAVLCIDIDKFKELNDSLGHSAGDTLLREVAARLKGNLRDGDFAARCDGDEFAAGLTGFDSAREAVCRVEELAQELLHPLELLSDTVDFTLSIGVAMAPDHGNDTSSLIRYADLALTRAKKEASNTVRFFEREMDLAFLRRREREADLKRALERQEFEVLYQPQVWLQDETLCGHEALVRWHHPVHGKVSPAYFISIAEETELIVPLGEWILRRACQDAAAWKMPGKVAVNLSPVQFRKGAISDLVQNVLDEVGLDPQRLELEITESLLMWDTETVLAELNKLRDLGVTVAMDDFGTGYSSLSYLSRFPFGKIKIDRSFVRAMQNDHAVNAIISCILGLGRSIDVTITAEGVETTEQAQLLRQLGCDQAQGFLYGRPADAAEAARRVVEMMPPTPARRTSAA